MKKISKIFVIGIVCAILVVFIKGNYESLLLNKSNYGMPALIQKSEIDNLFIGSSMFRQGLDIDTLNQNGQNNYILAYNGNQPVLESWIIDNLVSKETKIKNIYVDMYLFSLCSEPSISDSRIFMETDLEGKWELWNILQGTSSEKIKQFWEIFVSSNNELVFTWPISNTFINERFKQGGKIADAEGISEERINSLEMPHLNNIDGTQVDAIKKIAEMAKKEGISLTFIETPKYQSVMNNADYQNYMAEYCKILEQAGISYILASDINTSIMKDSYNYTDLQHMSSKGRKLFTNDLVVFLKDKVE